MASSWPLRLIKSVVCCELPVASALSNRWSFSLHRFYWQLVAGNWQLLFTSNHRAPQLVRSSLLRSGNACAQALHRRRGLALPESPATAPVRVAPETCRLTLVAMACCRASASDGLDDLRAIAGAAGTGSS